jgi:hypothetical protein
MSTAMRLVIKSTMEIANLIAGYSCFYVDLIIKKNYCECQNVEFIFYRIKLQKPH